LDEFNNIEKILDSSSLLDPVWIEIDHISTDFIGKNYLKGYDRAYYKISFWSYVDIWFEETEIGKINQNRLIKIFQKLNQSLNVIGRSCSSDYYPEEKLKEIFIGTN
jgi:hypothetical protein